MEERQSKAAEIGGLDGKTQKENDEALEAAYQDDQPPFMKRMRSM